MQQRRAAGSFARNLSWAAWYGHPRGNARRAAADAIPLVQDPGVHEQHVAGSARHHAPGGGAVAEQRPEEVERQAQSSGPGAGKMDDARRSDRAVQNTGYYRTVEGRNAQ